MGARGPKSAEQNAVVRTTVAVRAVAPTPDPFAPLTPGERAIWDQVIGSKPAGWFTAEIGPLLEAYCAAVETGRFLATRIAELQAADSVDEARLFSLLKAKDRETRGASSLATKLRLTPQSRYTPATAGRSHDAFNAAPVDPVTGKRKPKPWEC